MTPRIREIEEFVRPHMHCTMKSGSRLLAILKDADILDLLGAITFLNSLPNWETARATTGYRIVPE